MFTITYTYVLKADNACLLTMFINDAHMLFIALLCALRRPKEFFVVVNCIQDFLMRIICKLLIVK